MTYQYATPIPNTATPTSTPIYRHPNFAPLLSPSSSFFSHSSSSSNGGSVSSVEVCTPFDTITTFHGSHTLHETFLSSSVRTPHSPCLGTRCITTPTQTTTTTTTNAANSEPEAGPYVWSSYVEIYNESLNLAAGLHSNGIIKPSLSPSQLGGGHCLGILLPNCKEWIVATQGCYMLSGHTLPIYPTLGSEGLTHILKETGVNWILTDSGSVEIVLDAVNGNSGGGTLKGLILVDGVSDSVRRLIEVSGTNIQLMSYAQVSSQGRRICSAYTTVSDPGVPTHYPFLTPPSPSATCTISYTSGTSSLPKGTPLTHYNLLSTISSLSLSLSLYPTDRHISYLPLPHIFERLVTTALLANGSSIGFIRPGSTAYLLPDITALQPTIFTAAPRVLNKIHSAIQTKVDNMKVGSLGRRLYESGMKSKMKALSSSNPSLTNRFYDRLVFAKIKHSLGLSSVRLMLSGSAPLSPAVHNFFRCIMSLNVQIGYGATENSGCATFTFSGADLDGVGHCGGPMPGLEVKLVDCEGYSVSDVVHGDGDSAVDVKGRGEVYTRSPGTFAEYIGLTPAQSDLTEDKWLKTGDVGAFLKSNNALAIIDRVKNIFKLSQGEYVACEKVEGVICGNSGCEGFVVQCVLVADSNESFCVAVVVGVKEKCNEWRQLNPEATHDDLCIHITNLVNETCRKAGLKGFEIPRAVHLTFEEFATGNSMMTPSFKIKRREVARIFKGEIWKLYERERNRAKL